MSGFWSSSRPLLWSVSRSQRLYSRASGPCFFKGGPKPPARVSSGLGLRRSGPRLLSQDRESLRSLDSYAIVGQRADTNGTLRSPDYERLTSLPCKDQHRMPPSGEPNSLRGWVIRPRRAPLWIGKTLTGALFNRSSHTCNPLFSNYSDGRMSRVDFLSAQSESCRALERRA